MEDNGIKLSIIIPCYNSERTLEEAVSPCYEQGLSEKDFEIIMVDDGSTDGTHKIIDDLQHSHTNIKSITHKSNRGGGAARNTGIKAAKGELIYCLDSDNFFGPGQPLKKMISFLDSNGADGVIFHERRFFVGNNSKLYSSQWNDMLERPIHFEDHFNQSGIIVDNFLCTKKSYEVAGGYPENHGLDTPEFEVKYLATGNKLLVCPDSIFYHRQAQKQESYFEREYNSGNFSRDYYLITEHIFDKLSDMAKMTVLKYDIFSNTSLDENLKKELEILCLNGKLFKSNGSDSTPDGKDAAILHKFSSFLRDFESGSYLGSVGVYRGAYTVRFYYKSNVL